MISFEGNSRGAAIEGVEGAPGDWRAQVRAGILPGSIALRIQAPRYRAAMTHLTIRPDNRDSVGDGTPDFLRLNDLRDQEAFRDWFVWLAEAQYFLPPEARPAGIDDCAALIRFAYREALATHDSAWANTMRMPELPQFASPAKYRYPYTPLGAALFRVEPGSFQPADASDGKFLQFADAKNLWRFNTYTVSRDISRAEPGDLLFYRRQTGEVTYHGMIYVGPSKIRPDGRSYVVYHTGPIGSGAAAKPGEFRRPTVEELTRFPQPEWRPIAANPAFLGVMRWNILRRSISEPDASLPHQIF